MLRHAWLNGDSSAEGIAIDDVAPPPEGRTAAAPEAVLGDGGLPSKMATTLEREELSQLLRSSPHGLHSSLVKVQTPGHRPSGVILAYYYY